MTLATVSFTFDKSTPYVATLTEAGWSCPDVPAMARILDLDSPLSHFGPADGDPVKAAATRAAEFLRGDVTHVRPAPFYPPDTVF